MELFIEIILEIVMVSGAAIVFSHIAWRLSSRKLTFGDFLQKYGELIGYVALLALVLIFFLIEGWLE
jgi:hypothetical protein